MSEQIPKKPKAIAPEKSEASTVLVLIVLVLSVVVGYFIFFSEDKSFILKAKFTQADGLKAGAEVQCAGVKVGSVKEIRFLGIPEQTSSTEQIFELILELNPTINGQPIEKVIHKDAAVVIIIVGALGDRGVNIVPGTLSAPPVANGDYILGKIELTPAMISVNLQVIRKKFTDLQKDIEANLKWINDGKGNLGKYSKANNEAALNLKKLMAATDSLEPLLEKGNGSLGKFRRDKQFEARIERLSELANKLQQQLQKGTGATGRFMQDETLEKRINLLQERAIKLSSRFEQVAERAQKGKGSAGQFMSNPMFKKDLKELEDNLNKLSQKVSNKKGTIHLVMTDQKLSENLSLISIEMAKLAYDIRQQPRKYVKFTLF